MKHLQRIISLKRKINQDNKTATRHQKKSPKTSDKGEKIVFLLLILQMQAVFKTGCN